MCLQCLCEAKSYGEVIPGWLLMTSSKGDKNWPLGYWGLVQSNDPTFVWEHRPLFDPHELIESELKRRGIKQPEIDKRMEKIEASTQDRHPLWREFDNFHHKAETFSSAICSWCPPNVGFELISACIKAGYNPKEDGDVAFWLFSYMGYYLATKQPKPVHHSKEKRCFKKLVMRPTPAIRKLLPKGVL
jgi:hypothetical protein